MKRTLAIGDIHGGFKALEQILKRANITQKDKLIFLGDFVDGWSQSKDVIAFLIELSKRQECIFIKGNHDAWCLDWLQNGNTTKLWLKNGGEMTVESYKNISQEDKKQHIAFFEGLRNYFSDDKNRLFIHAGFSSMHGPAENTYANDNNWDRTLWETAVALDKKLHKNSAMYPKRLLLFSEIFIGHTPTLYLGFDKPTQMANVWNLDTGAAFTGSLSIMDINTKEYWQSDSLPTLYPNESGRN